MQKLDLNILKIDWAITILSSKQNFRIFLINFEKFSRWGKLLLLRQFLGYPQQFFFTLSLMNPFNYKLVNNGSKSPKRGSNRVNQIIITAHALDQLVVIHVSKIINLALRDWFYDFEWFVWPCFWTRGTLNLNWYPPTICCKT